MHLQVQLRAGPVAGRNDEHVYTFILVRFPALCSEKNVMALTPEDFAAGPRSWHQHQHS